jgi:hypothetical protein
MTGARRVVMLVVLALLESARGGERGRHSALGMLTPIQFENSSTVA